MLVLHAVAPAGFECQLTRASASAPPPLHAWAACAAPARLSALPDGTLLFEVRAIGEPCLQPSAQRVRTAALSGSSVKNAWRQPPLRQRNRPWLGCGSPGSAV